MAMIQFSSSLLIRPLIRPAYKSLQALVPQAGSFYGRKLRTCNFNHNLKNESFMARANKSHQLHYVASPTYDRATSFPEFEGNKITWKEGKEMGNIRYLDIRDGIGDQCAEKGDEVRVKYILYHNKSHEPKDDVPAYKICLGKDHHEHNHDPELDEGIYGMKREGIRRIVTRHNHKHKWKILHHHEEEHKIYDLALLDIVKPEK
ncbi:hypothetical protein O6P43_017312 [Quillaja saponaria]|uniref:Uncharacterized protein n=1 Tax=Quillaja saponaria TaxID=32244 RepID=A0AAD7LPM5_QUISA|nr:hypothetical protein O6P43_017312 [Quillaja saponaria]